MTKGNINFIIITLLFGVLLNACNSVSKKQQVDSISSNKSSTINSLMRFHDVEQKLTKRPQREIVPFLGKPDSKGLIAHCENDFAYFFVYFNKVKDDNGLTKHLVILTVGYSGVGETALGRIYNIKAIEDGDKVFGGFVQGCAAQDEYIKVSKSGISSNSREFEIH